MESIVCLLPLSFSLSLFQAKYSSITNRGELFIVWLVQGFAFDREVSSNLSFISVLSLISKFKCRSFFILTNAGNFSDSLPFLSNLLLTQQFLMIFYWNLTLKFSRTIDIVLRYLLSIFQYQQYVKNTFIGDVFFNLKKAHRKLISMHSDGFIILINIFFYSSRLLM